MNPRARLAVAGALLVAGIGSMVVGVRIEIDRSDRAEPATSAAPATAAATTPVLSARRVPDLLVRPQAARRLAMVLTPMMPTAPPQTCVVVSDGATTVFGAQPDLPMPAASNQKLVTALAALDVLGPDTTLTTRLAAAAAPTGGVVQGDLWFIGGGDPLIDSDTYQSTLRYGSTPRTRLEDIADRVVAAGVTTITGSVRGDESRYDAVRSIPTWPSRYLAQAQVGPLSALSVNDARTYAVVAPGSGAQPAADPAAYAATALTQLLQQRGVTVGGPPASGTAPAGVVDVAAVPSLPIRDIVREMLTFSDNNTAELLLKEVGLQAGGAGTTEAGLAAARQVLTDHGLMEEGIVLTDGSGLDTGNRLTCRLLAEVLATDGPDGPIAAGLAVADGPDGTLRDRFTRSPAAGLVRAKTGTLRGVTALSGWVDTTKDADVIFSTIINTGDRDVIGADLTFEQRVAEAVLGYPDSVDPATVAPE